MSEPQHGRAAPFPLIVSYYTPGTAYEAHANALVRSLDRLGLDHRVEPRPAKASWVENCAQKALFVREMRHEHDRSLLWIDADAVARRPLREFEGLDADFAVVRRDGWSFYAGQIYFGAGPQAREFIERWCAYCTSHPHVWDQVSLGYAWWDMALEGRLRSHWLPETVSAKMMRGLPARLVQSLLSPAGLLHRQASRGAKKRQRPATRQEFRTDDLPGWWRQAAARDEPFVLNAARAAELGLG